MQLSVLKYTQPTSHSDPARLPDHLPLGNTKPKKFSFMTEMLGLFMGFFLVGFFWPCRSEARAIDHPVVLLLSLRWRWLGFLMVGMGVWVYPLKKI